MTLPIVSLLVAWSTPVPGQESPGEMASPSATVTPTPTASPTQNRNVRISFLPPPLDGTISLGIYDGSGKLVRILHEQAPLDDFTVGADALITKWDGKDDNGQDLPAGKYHARGYLVGRLRVENLGKESSGSAAAGANEKVQIRLMANPLAKNERPMLDLALGFDDQNTFLKSNDDLPLFTISERTNIAYGSLLKNGEKTVDVWQEDGSGPEHLRIFNIDKVMAFDCGDLELK
ncbi:MAG: FlgD Ig-like domain [Verrucomicrobiota bacterium]|jgi:hypothetical protein